MTARILRDERPDAVFVMTPPVFAALPAFWYAWRHGAHVVLDAHTAAFLHPRWRRLQWLQRAALPAGGDDARAQRASGRGRRGAWARTPRSCPTCRSSFDVDRTVREAGRLSVAVVCSFNYDEPIVPRSSRPRARLPDVRFFMTGNPEHLPRGAQRRAAGQRHADRISQRSRPMAA